MPVIERLKTGSERAAKKIRTGRQTVNAISCGRRAGGDKIEIMPAAKVASWLLDYLTYH